MTVITMSRQIGSGAAEVANKLGEEMGLVTFDKRLMLRVAAEVGLSDEEIFDYSEEQYKARGFFERLFSRNRPVAEVSSWTGGGEGGYEREVSTLDEQQAIALTRTAMRAAYEHGNVLIVGRGSQVVLEDKPDVIHLRVVAPFEARVEYMEAEENMSPAQARRYIQEQDRVMADYMRQFYNADVDDPTLYHMVLNVAKLGVDRCVALIKATVELATSEPEVAET
jgi:CMP/dCMP kinase